jgi:hypothetical protein
MDKKTLVSTDVEEGQKLVRALENQGLPISAAMWLKRADEGIWRLYISTPDVEAHGPIAVYNLVDKVIRKGRSNLVLDNVVAANTTNHFINSVARKFRDTSSVASVSNSTFDDVPVEDAFVYKAARGVRPSKSPPSLKPTQKSKLRHIAKIH